MLLAEHNLMDILQIITSILIALVVPWVISVERRLSKIDGKLSNGIAKEVQGLNKEVYSQRKEFGKRIHDVEIVQAKAEGGQAGSSDIHS